MDISVFPENIRNLLNRFTERIQRLLVSERDRKALFWGAVVLLVLLIYLVFQSFSSGSAKLAKRAETLEADLNRIQSLRMEYIESKRRVDEATRKTRAEDEPLISLVEKILVAAQVERGNFSISSRMDTSGDLYDEKSVDVDIKKIPLNKVVDLLYGIQTNPNFLKVSKFRIRTRFDNPSLLDASFRVSTFRFKQVN
jgi:type II secretory pathway component PulM